MSYPADLNNLRLMTEEEARRTVYLAVLRELRYLRWGQWKKGMTIEAVLRAHGVDDFANGLVDSIAAGGLAMVRRKIEGAPRQPFIWPPAKGDEF